ncbi:PIG-L deacetylase family protein [Stenotrophomonas chelatiphaga]|uniref:PIG-L deacetylase family protein n=1 Tax=Stenotrophomonas chelatiphaga TaxID=517011 RepID=UPI0028A24A66|nr:PIG-L deacetylase family protein [Stenotrophomonas chelatiphaga]
MRTVHRVLAIGAHPDDLELGCGASLAKLTARGVHVRALVLTDGLRGVAGPVRRCEETRNALEQLGVTDVVQHRLPDTALPTMQAELIKLIEAHSEDLSPDRVYTMFRDDRHQDHRAVYEASIIACRSVPQILSYETPSSWPNFMPVVFEPVGDHIAEKIAALRHHVSQRDRTYMQASQIFCSAQFRGQQVGLGPSEGFIPYKLAL